MSTEQAHSPDLAKKQKKHKKSKSASENSTKKRKHDDQPAPAEPTPNSPVAERPSKRRKSHSDKPAADAKASPSPTSKTPKPSKTAKLSKTSKPKSHSTITTDPLTQQSLETHTPFHTLTTSLYLPLSPLAQPFPLTGLCAEHLSPHLLTYYPPLHGVLLAYHNPRLSEHPSLSTPSTTDAEARGRGLVLAKSVDEYAVSYVWLTAEFVVFAPVPGRVVEGVVGVQNESLLGVVCWNYFNAVVEARRLPKGWRWRSEVGDEDAVEGKQGKKGAAATAGYWVDAEGKRVEGKVVLRVEDFEATGGEGGAVSIIGSMREEGEAS